MTDVSLIEVVPGHKGVRFTEVSAMGTTVHDVPLAAIAAWRELLGIGDPVEALMAILHVRTHGEPPPDEDGVTAWSGPHLLLRAREVARENAAEVAMEEWAPEHPRSVRLRAAQAAYDAVHQKIGDGDCAMDRCRRDTRRVLGLPEPSRGCGVATRHMPPVVTPPRIGPVTECSGMEVEAQGPLTREDDLRASCFYALEGTEAELLTYAQGYLHALAESGQDPLGGGSAEPEPITAQDVLDHYQQEQQ